LRDENFLMNTGGLEVILLKAFDDEQQRYDEQTTQPDKKQQVRHLFKSQTAVLPSDGHEGHDATREEEQDRYRIDLIDDGFRRFPENLDRGQDDQAKTEQIRRCREYMRGL
jgi:nucleosome binding factor SPN SPT16 subunit